MKRSYPEMHFASTLLVVLGFAAGTLAIAAETAKPSPPAVTKEQREKMALAHEKFAGCLRSDRTLGDCRQELMEACHGAKGGASCSMMTGGEKMKGAKHSGEGHADAHQDTDHSH